MHGTHIRKEGGSSSSLKNIYISLFFLLVIILKMEENYYYKRGRRESERVRERLKLKKKTVCGWLMILYNIMYHHPKYYLLTFYTNGTMMIIATRQWLNSRYKFWSIHFTSLPPCCWCCWGRLSIPAKVHNKQRERESERREWIESCVYVQLTKKKSESKQERL